MSDRRPTIIIEGGDSLLGNDTRIFVLRADENGEEEKIDISSVCRSVDLSLAVGEVNVATLEVFVTNTKARAEVEEVVLEILKPRRRGWRSRLKDVTTFNRTGSKEHLRVRA